MTYTTDTTIIGSSKGDPAKIIAWLKTKGCQRPDEVEKLITTFAEFAPQFGIRFEVPVGLVLQECSLNGVPLANSWWIQNLNAGSIGITGDPVQNAASRKFPSGRECALAILVHLYIYAKSATLPTAVSKYQSEDWRFQAVKDAGWIGIAPTLKGLSNHYAADPIYAEGIAAHLNALDMAGLLTDASSVPTPPKETPVADKITFGNVPKFGYIDRQSQTADKPAGVGWDNLGKRNPKGIVLHRMVGSLSGTDSWFGAPSVGSLTDFGIGIKAQDGTSLSKVIYQWNDPHGYRAGWASGPVNGAYGDGIAFVDKYGINAVNRDLISIEISGQYTTPIADDEFEEIASFLAYWWDQMYIPYDKAPTNPATGISAVYFHQEMTLGTGKICPGPVVMNAIDDLIARAVAIMKKYQTSTTATPTPPVAVPPVAVPDLIWSAPKPIAELAKYTKADADSAPDGIQTSVGLAIWVDDDIEAIRDTTRRQEPSKDAKYVGPTLKKGTSAHALWEIIKPSGERWYYSDWYTCFLVSDFKRVKD